MHEKRPLRIWIEIIIASCFYWSGLVKLARWWRQHSGRSLIILNYHRAIGEDLPQQMLYLKRHYRVLHLETALEELYKQDKRVSRGKDRRTPLVLTFDDGYHDNYTHGYKLANALHVPITIFLVPTYIESGQPLGWLAGEEDHFVSFAAVSEVTIEGHIYHLDNTNEQKALERLINDRARHPSSIADREQFLASTRSMLAVPTELTPAEQAALPLTWAEVQEMEESGWVSFGAHTMHHPLLACLTDTNEVYYEVSACRASLEHHLGHPVYAFAYPYGLPEQIGEYGRHAVQEAMYKWAVTTTDGFNTPDTDPLLLHRIVVGADQHWLSIAVKASGVWSLFSRLYRKSTTFIAKGL